MRCDANRALGEIWNLPSAFVVDDEKIIAKTLAMILRQSGFDAKFFADPAKAFCAAVTEAPDLLLSDVMISQLSGIDLAIAIRENCPECRVLLFPVRRGRQTFFQRIVRKVMTFICFQSRFTLTFSSAEFENKILHGLDGRVFLSSRCLLAL